MQLDDDDLPIGHVLSRRDAVRLFALGGAAVLVGCKPGSGASGATSEAAGVSVANAGVLPACVARPELTVGPYFLDQQLNRADIRTDPGTNAMKEGAPLMLTFNVQQIASGRCSPLPDAMVDVWQCDAQGQYSGVNDRMVGFNTVGQKFLRGYQVTDAGGVAKFLTVYPGWYQGRAVHIHFKIRTPAQGGQGVQAAPASPAGQAYEFTSQLFFDEALTDQVHAQAPYASKGQRTLRNERDGIFRQAGETLVLATTKAGQGYEATFDVGLDLSDTKVGAPDRGRGPGGPPGGRRRPPEGG